MNKIVAFDLDGTLSRSDRFIVPAYRQKRAEMGYHPLPDETIKELIGGTLEGNYSLLLPDKSYEEYCRYSHESGIIAKRLAMEQGTENCYPHLPQALQELVESGYRPVLCTNGGADYGELILQAIGIRKFFGEIPRKREPNWTKVEKLAYILEWTKADAAVMVGDRHFDQEAAKGNGVPFIGCRYGLFPQEVVHADVVINDPIELPDAVNRLIG